MRLRLRLELAAHVGVPGLVQGAIDGFDRSKDPTACSPLNLLREQAFCSS